jgi:hypothetical protein
MAFTMASAATGEGVSKVVDLIIEGLVAKA